MDTSRAQGTPPNHDSDFTRSQAHGPDAVTYTAGFALDPPTKDWTAPKRLRPAPPGYDLIRYLDRGGMGDVYVAREHFAQRVVALKYLRPTSNPTTRDRFLEEIRTLGAIEHPHVVRIFSADADRDDPFYAMEYCAGGSLADRLKTEGPYSPEAAARIGIQLADALAAVHRADRYHRDIKPSNVLFTADGVPKLSDFGLAKMMDDTDNLTRTTQAIGTPAFMPPEQISRKLGKYTPATDVYGLGATLYAMLTGMAPFAGDSNEEILLKVKSDTPVRPRVLRPDVPMGMEAVVLKCLEKRPADRYDTAEDLAQDLERCLEGLQRARPQTRFERTKRWVKRNATRIGSVCIVLAIISAAAAQLMKPAPQAPKPPDSLQDMQKELAAGKVVTLIPSAGLPAWHRWLLGSPELVAPRGGPCRFEAISHALLELCPDPMSDHYVVRAKMQFEESKLGPGGLPGSVTTGFFFGHASAPGNDGSNAQVMIAVHFDDMLPRPPPPPAKLPDNAVRMQAVRIMHRANGEAFAGQVGIANAWTPISRNMRLPGPWRAIELEVSAERVVARFEAIDGKLQQFASVAVEDLRRCIADLTLQLNAGGAGFKFPDWHPRMPLGIWSHRAALSVKDVSVTPIP